MHVYHYAFYEPAVLKRLMGQYGTREEEVDDLLRREVLVDLFAVVRQALRASYPSYSLKDIERFYLDGREAEVKGGADSVVALRAVARDAATTRCSRRSAPTTRRTASRRCSCATGCSSGAPRPSRSTGASSPGSSPSRRAS